MADPMPLRAKPTVIPVATDDVPELVQWWVRSLLDPEVIDVVRAAGDRPVEVRLYANKGKVRRQPSVLVGVVLYPRPDPFAEAVTAFAQALRDGVDPREQGRGNRGGDVGT